MAHNGANSMVEFPKEEENKIVDAESIIEDKGSGGLKKEKILTAKE